MILDATHKPWLWATSASAVAGVATYSAIQAFSVQKMGGGTPFGLLTGAAGAAIVVFAGLLGVRKRRPTLRVGRPHLWLKGHVWLGVLSFLLILLHSGFSLGGTLTQVLMILFGLIVFSGVVGMVLQQILPRYMLNELPEEVTFEQMDVALSNLKIEVDQIVTKLGGAVDEPAVSPGDTPDQPPPPLSEAQVVLNRIYSTEIRPYLLGDLGRQVGNRQTARVLFEHLRKVFPPVEHDRVLQLEALVRRRGILARQKKLHYALHGWLLVHAPLSAAMFVLLALHICVALLLT